MNMMKFLQGIFGSNTWQGLSQQEIQHNVERLIEENKIRVLIDRLETIESLEEKKVYEIHAFKYSAGAGNVGCMELLSSRVDYAVKVEALSWAAASNITQSLELLLSSSNIKNEDKQIALNSAVFAGHIESTRVLIDSGLSEDQLQRGLEFAVAEGVDRLVPLFLERGVVSNYTVFVSAVRKVHTGLMDLLLSADGVVSEDVYIEGLKLAAQEGIINSLEFLFARSESLGGISADVYADLLKSAANAGQIPALEFLFARSESLGGISADVYADLLKSAANAGQIPALEFLFGFEGRNVDDTEYSSVIRSAVWGGDNATVEYLLARKVVSDEVYLQVLEEGVYSNNQEIFQFLVAHHVLSDDDYSRVLQRAASAGQIESLKFLLEFRVITDEMKTFAWLAAVTSYIPGQGLECAELLSEQELDVQGQLIHALIMSNEFFVKKMLACGANIETQHEEGQTLYERVDAGSILTPVSVTFGPEIQNLFRKAKAINDDTSLSEDTKKIVKAKVFTGYWFSETEFDALKADAIIKAGEFLSSISGLDEANRLFVLENYIFVNDGLSGWLDAWKNGNDFDMQDMMKMGPKGLVVNLAVHCGGTIDGLEDLFGKSKGAIMQFMDGVRREKTTDESVVGKVLPCSVVGQALRGLAHDPALGIPGKETTWMGVMKFLTLDDINFSGAASNQTAEDTDQSTHLAGVAAEHDADVA
jgi:hypothetical protein